MPFMKACIQRCAAMHLQQGQRSAALVNMPADDQGRLLPGDVHSLRQASLRMLLFGVTDILLIEAWAYSGMAR